MIPSYYINIVQCYNAISSLLSKLTTPNPFQPIFKGGSMRNAFRALVVSSLLLPAMAFACFDTYLFLQKSSMVYPEGQMVAEMSGEYVIPQMKNSIEDIFSGGMNLYYGFSKRFSMQVGVSSSEKARSDFGIDGYGIRGVFGVIQGYRDVYNLDIILEHAAPFDFGETAFELSAPGIFHYNDLSFVVHPVTSFGNNVSFNIRGHGGAFYRFGTGSIVGIGSEYSSAQSGSQFGRRLVKGEGATSLFFGSQVGMAYLQNEFIKGWGAEGNDFGFAATVKFLLPSFSK
jgi:hypothetical protein